MERSDVIVVGAGAIGLSCAREILRLGAAGVLVLEALPAAGQGSSSRANGGFRAQFTTPSNISFSLYSIGELEDLEERTGLLALRQNGYVLMTGAEPQERRLRAARDLQRSLGVGTEWLSPGQIADLAPPVRTEGLLGGTFHARDGFLDPAGLVSALQREAKDLGAEMLFGADVTGARRKGNGIVLRHGQGEVEAKIVVNAAGPRAAEVAAILGASIPVEPVRRNLALFLDPEPRRDMPMCVDLDTGVLVRPEAAGGWIAAYSDPNDPPGWDVSLDPRFLEQLAERASNRFPFLADLPVDPARCWAGLYPETPDHHAVIGPDPHVAGLIHCAGFGGHGLMHAPAAGRAVAELVTRGRSDTFDLHPLRPSRFEEGDLVTEPVVL